jgi:hypothetical protein
MNGDFIRHTLHPGNPFGRVRRRQFRGITAHRAIEQYTPLLHQDTNVCGIDAGLVCELGQYVLFQFQVSFHKPDISFVDGCSARDTNQSIPEAA